MTSGEGVDRRLHAAGSGVADGAAVAVAVAVGEEVAVGEPVRVTGGVGRGVV